MHAAMACDFAAGTLENAAQPRRPKKILKPVVRSQSKHRQRANWRLPQPIRGRQGEMSAGLYDTVEFEDRALRLLRVFDRFRRKDHIEAAGGERQAVQRTDNGAT